MNNPTREEITAIEEEILEERSREVEWQSRSDWIDDDDKAFFQEKQTFLNNIDHHIIRSGEIN